MVLCDLIMPGLNGDSLTAAFRAWEREERPGEPIQPIYALTAYANAESRARCLKVGMQGAPLNQAASHPDPFCLAGRARETTIIADTT